MQIDRNLIAFVVLRCFGRFDLKSMQIDRNLIAFQVLRCFDRSDVKSMQFIVISTLLQFCVVLIVLTSNRCNSWYFDHFWSFALFSLFCDVTEHFRSFRRQIDANSS